MFKKKLAVMLVTAMVVTTFVPAAYATDTIVNTEKSIISEKKSAAIPAEGSNLEVQPEITPPDRTISEPAITAPEEVASAPAITPTVPDTTTSQPAITTPNPVASQPAITETPLEEEQIVKLDLSQITLPDAKAVIDRTKDSTMYKHLENLSEKIGARIAGTESETMAKDYVESVFKSLGYEADVQSFKYVRKEKEYDSNNVIAIKQGKSEKQIIVGAHYDSVSAATGTSDNGSGVATMLAVASAIKDIDTEYTVKFIAFGAEEVGLKGSAYFASQMSKEEISNTIAMVNLDTILFGDKMYVYGEQGDKGWVRDQALEMANTLGLNIVTQQGLNPEYPVGTTGDWSDHSPFKKLGIPWIYFESTNWDLKNADGTYSEGDHETEEYGEIMHTGQDNMTFMEQNKPGRMEDRLFSFTTLLIQLIENIKPVAPKVLAVSNGLLSMSEEKDIEITAELGYEPKLENITWTFGGKPLESYRVIGYDKKTGKPYDTETPLFTFTEAPTVSGTSIVAKLHCGLLFGKTNLEGRPFPRRIYPNYLGNYELTVADTETKATLTTAMKLNAYDSYHTQAEVLPAVNEIIDNAKKDRYIEYAPLGKSAEGRDIPFVMFSRDKKDIETYLNETLPMMLEHPAEFQKKIADKTAGNYKPVIWFNNIHSDEANGVDGQIDLLRQLAVNDTITFKQATENNKKDTLEEVTLDVQQVLDNFIIVFSLNNNPDGRFSNNRATAAGFDPNRDVTYQTQVETATVFQALARWSPMIFNDYHGFVKEFLIEPCTPPHEPNFEYDLLMESAIDHAHALGRAGIANTSYPNYIIPMFDYGQGWDDGAPMYAAVLSLLHGAVGHTVEIPELNQDSNNGFMYAGMGSIQYALENKEKIFKNQLEIYRRGVEGIDDRGVDKWLVNANKEAIGRPRGGNENFFPEYYVLPTDKTLQKNPLEAYEMAEFLIKNGVKLEKSTTAVQIGDKIYPAGSFVVDMHQAKRGFANTVLYDGSDFSDFAEMYAEVTMCFPMLRGFDKYEIRVNQAFEGKTEAVEQVAIPETTVPTSSDMVVIDNTNNDVINAVNALLEAGKTVYMTYSAGSDFSKGDFVIKKADLEGIKNKYFLEAKPFMGTATVKSLKTAKVAGYGSELNFVLDKLGFERVDSYTGADVIVDENGTTISADMQTAIREGSSYIAVGAYAIDAMETSGLLPGLKLGSNGEYYEGVLRADLDTDSVITGNYNSKDILYNNSASWIEGVPTTSKVLATISNENNFYVAGWWPQHDVVKGKAYILQDKLEKGKITLFATHLVNKAHPSHQFRLLANAIYDGTSGDLTNITVSGNGGGSGSSGGGGNGSNAGTKPPTNPVTDIKPPVTPAKKEAKAFVDVKTGAWYCSYVNYAVEKGWFAGTTDKEFSPDKKMTREMFRIVLGRMGGDVNKIMDSSRLKENVAREQMITLLYRLAKEKGKTVSTAQNTDMGKFGDWNETSEFAKEAMQWAYGVGLIQGNTNTTLTPKAEASRAEVATLLMRFDSLK